MPIQCTPNLLQAVLALANLRLKENRMANAKYRATPRTLADGDFGDMSLDANENLKVSQATAIAGEDLANDAVKVEQRYTNTRCTADTLVKTGVGQLHAVIVTQPASATPTAGVFTIYDNTVESGLVLFQQYFPASAVPTPVTIPLNCIVTVGIYASFDATLAGLAFNLEYR